MFTRISLVFASLVAATALAAAGPPDSLLPDPSPPKKPEQPPTLAPQVGTVIALDGETGTIKYSVVVPRTIHELVFGPDSRLQFRVIGWQYERVIRTAKMDQLQFFDGTGKRLTTNEVWKRLMIGTDFFVSADGKPVSAAHLKLIAPNALVVVDFDNVHQLILEEALIKDIAR